MCCPLCFSTIIEDQAEQHWDQDSLEVPGSVDSGWLFDDLGQESSKAITITCVMFDLPNHTPRTSWLKDRGDKTVGSFSICWSKALSHFF